MKFDNILIQNKARDKAWEAFIKRKDVKAFMEKNKDYKFPLDGSYELWCMAWEKAWDAGFKDGWESGMSVEREACARVCEQGLPFGLEQTIGPAMCAAAIRARGEG